MFLAGGEGADKIGYSSNGTAWAGVSQDVLNSVYFVKHNGTYWLAGGINDDGNCLMKSEDNGVTWEEVLNVPLYQAYCAEWNGSMWVVGGEYGGAYQDNTMIYSYDGETWTGLGKSLLNYDVQGIKWNGAMWIAVGYNDTTSTYVIHSYDGINWTEQASTTLSWGNCIEWNGSYWLIGGGGTNKAAKSASGLSWSPVTMPFTNQCYGLAWNGTRWVATGDGGYSTGEEDLLYSLDGESWTAADTMFAYGGRDVAFNDGLFVAGGNRQTDATHTDTLAYSADGISWTGLGNGAISTTVRAVAGDEEVEEDFIILLIRYLIQGGSFFGYQGRVYIPDFHCCPLGDYMGVAKLPVPSSIVEPLRVCVDENVTVDLSEAYSPTETALDTYYIDWDDGTTTEGNFPLPGTFTHSWSTPGFKSCYVQIADVDTGRGVEYFEIEVVNCDDAPDDELYIANASGIYKSEDGGVTWELSMDGPATYAVAANPFTATQGEKELLAACQDNGLYRTINSGASWQQVTYAYDALAVAYDKVYENKFYVLGRDESDDAVVSVTEDGGTTWEHYLTGRDAVTTPSHGLLVAAYFEEYLFFVTTTEGGAANENAVYRIATDLTGDTLVADWGEASNLVLRISQDDYVYAGGTYNATTQGLFMSDDYGASWEAIGSTDWSDMLYTLDITIDPFNTHNLLAVIARAAERVFYVSGDRGDTWKLVTNSDINVNMTERPKNDSETVYIGGTGSTTILAVSLWNGQDAFTRQASLPTEQTNDIAVVGA